MNLKVEQHRDIQEMNLANRVKIKSHLFFHLFENYVLHEQNEYLNP